MRTQRIQQTLAVLLALAAPTAGLAFEWAGRLGLGWTQQDDWTPQTHEASPTLDLDLGLNLHGAVSDPRIFWYRLGGSYQYSNREVNGVSLARSNIYTYSLASALFEGPLSPLSLSVTAQRIAGDLAGGMGAWTGTRTADFGAATLRLALPNTPRASASYAWNVSSDKISTLPDHDRNLQKFDVALEHGSGAFNLSAGYTGEWSSGTWKGDDYQYNHVRVGADAKLARDVTFLLSDSYYQRSPTSTFDAALAAEQHTLQAAVQHLSDQRDRQVGRYLYAHSAVSTPATGEVAATTQQLEYTQENRFDGSEYSALVNGNLALVEQDTGGTTTRTSGETLGLRGRWLRQEKGKLSDVAVGPSIGVLQRADGSNALGYGAAAQLSFTRPFGGFSATGRYDFTYGKDLQGVPGWSFRHTASASAGGALGPGRAEAQLQLSSVRSSSPTFGDTASRSILVTSLYQVRQTQYRALVAVGSGIAGNPGDKFVGDGLILPAPFNSHAISAGLSAQTAMSFGLTALAGVRYGDTVVPDQPSITQYGADASLSYRVGAFSVVLEDRYTAYHLATGRTAINVAWFKLIRAIGSGL